jgi:hypothetical protein
VAGAAVGRRVQRVLAAPDAIVRLRELRAEGHKREQARVRKAEQRGREAAVALDPEAFAAKQGHSTTATRIARKGMGDLYLSEKTGIWMRSASVGWDRPATRGDFTRRGTKVPASFEAEYGYGAPGYDRPPVGYVPEDQRVVARMSRVTESGATVTSPVQKRDLAQRLSEGWIRVS